MLGSCVTGCEIEYLVIDKRYEGCILQNRKKDYYLEILVD
jgi:hypothetical protein